MTSQVPVVTDLFGIRAAEVALLGSRCLGCGTYWFPRAIGCRNPDCADRTLVDTTLGRTGVLWSWTVQHYRPPAPFRVGDWEPYAIGAVELPERLRVPAMLTGAPPGQIPIGTPLQLTTLRLYHDVVTYAYQPAEVSG